MQGSWTFVSLNSRLESNKEQEARALAPALAASSFFLNADASIVPSSFTPVKGHLAHEK